MDLLTDVIDRITAQCPDFKHVAGAAAYANAAALMRNQYPAAFVVPLTETVGKNELTGIVCQQRITRFGVIMAISNLRDSSGQQALVDLTPIKKSVETALIGWGPPSVNSPTESAGGRLIGLNEGLLWWQADFTNEDYLRG